MSEPVKASHLRQDIYRLLDRVLETGEPLEIERKGRHLRVVVAEPPVGRLSRISGNPDVIVGDPDDLLSIDWSGEWSHERKRDDGPVTTGRVVSSAVRPEVVGAPR